MEIPSVQHHHHQSNEMKSTEKKTKTEIPECVSNVKTNIQNEQANERDTELYIHI